MKRRFTILALFPLLLAAAGPGGEQPIAMETQGLRSFKGKLLVCVTRTAAHFPDCSRDPDRRHFTVPAASAAIDLGMLAPGAYAIAIIHDENGNGKLDTFAGIPREGVGFSRNPPIRFGAPGFKAAQFVVDTAPVRQAIKVKYFL